MSERAVPSLFNLSFVYIQLSTIALCWPDVEKYCVQWHFLLLQHKLQCPENEWGTRFRKAIISFQCVFNATTVAATKAPWSAICFLYRERLGNLNKMKQSAHVDIMVLWIAKLTQHSVYVTRDIKYKPCYPSRVSSANKQNHYIELSVIGHLQLINSRCFFNLL